MIEDGSTSTINEEEGSNSSIMDDLQNPGDALFDTNSDSELEEEDNSSEVSYLPDCGFEDEIETIVIVDETRRGYGDLHEDFYDVARHIEGNRDQIRVFRRIIVEGRKEVHGEGAVLSISDKRKMIENFYGSQVPSKIEVHPPDLASTKGSRKRKVSRREKEIRGMPKPSRKCGDCGEVGHSSRNYKKIHEQRKKKNNKNE